jgi:DNA-directed RNA polymerase subunit M
MQKAKNYSCPKCGYTKRDKVKIQISEKIERGPAAGVLREKEIELLPTVNATCEKCGNKEAYFWTSQTRSADEAETRFFKCKKCGHSWREYS